MNQQIKSHWRLAWRTFVKAIKVTIDTIKEDHRARKYRLKIAPDLRSQKDYLEMIDSNAEQISEATEGKQLHKFATLDG
ncbi:MAG: hypothetical protein IT281_04900 [Ignavibacteria bacterium]|nr:hypothetical protein [Ignavibacteria bacterium]